ncbi:MAG: TlpA family protein disulfide reductase [Bacteroidales bacterium]|nr:TlpA family protein disulfide reductase [Bacteroidales bacterium]
MRRFLSGMTLAALAAACVYHQPDGQGIETGDRLPAFVVTMDDGSSLSSENLVGSPCLIVFFHTSCSDCRNTLPLVQKAYEQYAQRVRFVAISREQAASEVRSWWKEHGITLPFSAQEDRAVYELFASSRIPRIYICDGRGVVVRCFDDNPCPAFEDLDLALKDL